MKYYFIIFYIFIFTIFERGGGDNFEHVLNEDLYRRLKEGRGVFREVYEHLEGRLRVLLLLVLEGDVDAVEHVGEEGPEHAEVLAVLLLDDLQERARREERGQADVVGLGVQQALLEDVADHGKVPPELVGPQKPGKVRKDGERTLPQKVVG